MGARRMGGPRSRGRGPSGTTLLPAHAGRCAGRPPAARRAVLTTVQNGPVRRAKAAYGMRAFTERLLRIAANRWPASVRGERAREWAAEMHQLGQWGRLRF